MRHPTGMAAALVVLAGCNAPPERVAEPVFPTAREPCAVSDPLRRPLYGDLHVHTGYSFDARSYDTVLTPADAYRFARGETVLLPPLDAAGAGTRAATIDRPLDFIAVTDHGEFLGEVALCTTEGSVPYGAETCVDFRDPEVNGAVRLAIKLSVPGSPRFADICGAGDRECLGAARSRWLAMRVAAEEAYDRTSACTLTTFAAYEYTNTGGVSNLHRNVVFAGTAVPELPISTFEAPDPHDLWVALDQQCRSAGTGCDVVVLPHNSNLSNGNLFDPVYPFAVTEAEQAEAAALRASMEPVVEMFQHKGDSECRNGLHGVNGAPDPRCDFEKLRPPDAEVCGEATGSGGMRLQGCVHRLDFVRNVLGEGLVEEARLGVNPYRLGFIGSTDTHNGTPGNVATEDFPGHVGTADDTIEKRLGAGTVTHDGIINNPGGLAAVWAEENTREAIFAALKRRETFATSGPRIAVRFFGGAELEPSACRQPLRDLVADAYARGVPMGGELTAVVTPPTFVVWARADREPLERIQIIKGWLGTDGLAHEQVYDAGVAADDPGNGGWLEHCIAWTDPAFDPSRPAFYYARVLENPTPRWSTLQCDALPAASRPAACGDPAVPTTTQERAWSSPIHLTP